MKAVSTVSFSTDKLRADTDYFMKEESIGAAALPATAVNGVRLGNIQDAVELIVEVGATAISSIVTAALVVKLQSCTTKDGSFSDVTGGTILTLAIGQTRAAGAELTRYSIGALDSDLFYKAVATSNASSVGTINVYQHYIAR